VVSAAAAAITDASRFVDIKDRFSQIKSPDFCKRFLNACFISRAVAVSGFRLFHRPRADFLNQSKTSATS
jgi:hypothetical protein